MSSGLNKVLLIGRLGKEPEIRSTPSGADVANFSIAVDETYKDKQGEKQKKVEWINLVIWGPSVRAFVEPYLHKGDLVFVEGKLQTRSWDDKATGAKKYTTEVNVSDIKALSTGDNNSAQPAAKNVGARQTTTRQAMAQSETVPEIDENSIPTFNANSSPIHVDRFLAGGGRRSVVLPTSGYFCKHTTGGSA